MRANDGRATIDGVARAKNETMGKQLNPKAARLPDSMGTARRAAQTSHMRWDRKAD